MVKKNTVLKNLDFFKRLSQTYYRGATPFDKRYFALSGLFVGGPWIEIHGYNIGRPYRTARKWLRLLLLFLLDRHYNRACTNPVIRN